MAAPSFIQGSPFLNLKQFDGYRVGAAEHRSLCPGIFIPFEVAVRNHTELQIVILLSRLSQGRTVPLLKIPDISPDHFRRWSGGCLKETSEL